MPPRPRANATAPPVERRSDIDWLRVTATYVLFVFHVAKVFDFAPFYHVVNRDRSMVFFVLAGFIAQWHMPLFFLLAGWSLFGSLRGRSTSDFLRERARRLLLPFLLAFGAAFLLVAGWLVQPDTRPDVMGGSA